MFPPLLCSPPFYVQTRSASLLPSPHTLLNSSNLNHITNQSLLQKNGKIYKKRREDLFSSILIYLPVFFNREHTKEKEGPLPLLQVTLALRQELRRRLCIIEQLIDLFHINSINSLTSRRLRNDASWCKKLYGIS